MSGAVGLLLVAVLIAANGLFVAAEFALVSLRRPNIEDRAANGDRRAGLVSRELSEISFALSVAQFGITATSLLVGYVAERTLGEVLVWPVLDLLGLPQQAALPIAVTVTLVLSSLLQMLLGELFPKNLAISRPVGVALAVVPFTRTFGLVFGPVIRVFDAAAVAFTERVLKVPVSEELEAGHSQDELARIIAASGAEGSLSEEQAELLGRALALGDRRVGEVMVPRPDIYWLTVDDTLAELHAAARETGHSRFPVRGATEDEVVGSVHVKDLIGVPGDEHATTPVSRLATPMLEVPESEPLRRLLADLRREQRTQALVVDEYGGTAGLVTLEDVLEELVGEIEDEFDRDLEPIRRVGADRHLIPGALRVDRVGELIGHELPEGEYETVAGFVLDRLGHIPEPGESVTSGDLRFTVTRLEGVRITEVAVAADGADRSSAGPDGGGTP